MKSKPIDYPILIITLILVTIGIVMVFSASFNYAKEYKEDYYFFLKRQCIWAGIGLIGMLIMSRIKYYKLKKYAGPLLAISFVLLVLVLLVGVEKNDAKRWFNIFGISVQPSEIAKFSLIIFLAASMSNKKDKLKKFFTGVVPYLIIASAFAVLILMQPNMSTAGSILILTVVMLFLGGAAIWQILMLIGAGGGAALYLIKIADYRMDRLDAFIDPWSDPLETGYQIIQSLYAIGSGGLFGVGLGASRQKCLYLPYAETDFIFSIITEELGFFGASIIILLFFALIWRGVKIALSSPDLFGSLLAGGIISMIAIQAAINIAVVTKSMPATGLPLPFISFGGSSLAFFMGSIGILLNISKYSKPV